VGGRGNNVGVFERRRNDTGSDQSGDVSHIDHQVGADRIGNLAHASIVNQAAVGRGTSDKDLGAVEQSIGGESVIVNDAGLVVDAVGESLKVGRNGRDPAIQLEL
jgi:hypothetical protein